MRATHFTLSVLVAAVALVLRGFAAGAEGPLRRVRPTTSAIATLIDQATQWSPTLRGLVDAINRSDGLVYIEEGECPRHVRACLAHAVTIAGPHRLLHIKIDPHLNHLNAEAIDPEVIGVLGHELQHASEVLSNPHLRTYADVVNFYMREGTFSTGTVLETTEAERVGVVIEDEVRRARRKHSNP
jgi:hypothetical protein